MKGYKLNEQERIRATTAIIITYLNTKAGRKHGAASKHTLELIETLLGKGFVMKDFLLVVNYKCNSWSHVPAMKKYLKPSTLFASHNFHRYLAEAKKYYTNKTVVQ